MLIALWPIVFALLGLLVYFVSDKAKVMEVGRITFFVGLFWLVYTLASHVLRLG